MYKSHEKSRFEALSTRQLREAKRIVIQIVEHKMHDNGDGLAVFLCETVDPAEYERETVEGKLEVALEKLENQTAKADAMEGLLERAKDSQKEIAERLKRQIEENKKLLDALTECERIFGTLPPEIKELMEGDLEHVYNGAV